MLQQQTQNGEQYILSDLLSKSDKLLEIEGFVHDSGYGHQFTIIQTHNGQRDYYHFATKLGNEQMNNKYLWCLPELKQFINEYNDRVHEAEYHKQGEQGLIVPPPKENTQTHMRVLKRNGEYEIADLNKIVKAINRSCQGLNSVDAVRVATRTIAGLYDGATTSELDNLSIQTYQRFRAQ